jgi:lysophospholipase L1-like esterase
MGPKIILLGDSIRQSYQDAVRNALAGRADVVGPEENGMHAGFTLDNLDRWLAELGTPDVVHWNNGLHDIGHTPARSPHQFPLDAYTENLGRIRTRLRRAGAAIVWATTTPVRPACGAGASQDAAQGLCRRGSALRSPDREFTPDDWSWDNEEIVWYNATARELMESDDVKVNDLHALVAADPGRFLAEDGVHLSAEGVRECAAAVSAAVEEFI